ncbi:hypothetical protein [Nocardioides xinjiangensis]|uniref:hypothetical protein n=1 Tax=Nocardioides xinjiangensis TaxID=2817376 RepID=UPI001B30A8D6|nr:hypothetical protein [Nocardioides sp. SYSU D00514]
MSPRRSVRRLVVAVLLGVLVGGGLMAVTPAGAEVSQAAATSWKKIWKKDLKPLAAKTFHTKKQSDARYQPKGSYEPAGSGYTKSETYTRAEVDAKLAPFANSVAAFAGGDQAVTLEPADKVVRSVSLVPTANGTVVASSSAYAWASGAGDGGARCSLTTGNAVDFEFLQYANIPAAQVSESDVISGTRGFPVTKGNLVTVNLVCDEFAGNMTVSDSALTAVFAPS